MPLSHGADAESVEPIVFEISRNGTIHRNGLRMTVDQWRAEIATFSRTVPPPALQVVPDRNAPAGIMLEIMDAAGQMGLEKIQFTGKRQPGPVQK